MENRRQQILKTGVKLAVKLGYKQLIAKDIAKKLNISRSLVLYYFPNIADLHAGVLEEAINLNIPEIIVQAIVTRDKTLNKISLQQKRDALNILSSRLK